MTAPIVTVEEVADRLEVVRARIAAAGADPAMVQVVAVTKGFGPEVAAVARAAGLTDLGENYAQELLAKSAAVAEVRWHAIGRLQRNKVKALAPIVSLWQSVDRLALGETIAKHAPGAAVLVQVDISGEPQKGGCEPDQVPSLVEGLQALGLDVRGLMAVGPTGPPATAGPGFGLLTTLADRLALPVRSMGMSSDLEVAVSEGATMVRVGSDLVGVRPARRG